MAAVIVQPEVVPDVPLYDVLLKKETCVTNLRVIAMVRKIATFWRQKGVSSATKDLRGDGDDNVLVGSFHRGLATSGVDHLRARPAAPFPTRKSTIHSQEGS